jgi:hypothetical protein
VCARVRTKVRRKDWCWFVRLAYDPKELPTIMIARYRVVGVLQLVSESTIVVLWAHMSQLRRIR